jgi:hypothetical protein
MPAAVGGHGNGGHGDLSYGQGWRGHKSIDIAKSCPTGTKMPGIG